MKVKKIWLVPLVLLAANATAQHAGLQSFPVSSVRLLDGPFKKAQQTDMKYILALDMDRLLAPYLTEAGLTSKVKSYGNWENSGLNGHIGGHYLSALSYMYAATGNPELLRRLNYMIDELALCQEKNGDGYIGGVPKGRIFWKNISEGKIDAGTFSLNGQWVPFYNIHKVYAGLIDAYTVTGIPKAKGMLVKFADWVYNLTLGLSDTQLQVILRNEHGGMNDALAKICQITGNQKYLTLAKRFSHKAILNPLLHQQDSLTGLHANTQIPKVIGFEQIAELTHDTAWADAANFFWKTVVEHRSVAFGGNSVREHFNPVDDFSSMVEDREGPETCNSYNMLKLTKQLFLAKPSAAYIDYYERTLYNHILSSQGPNGGFVYFTPIRPRHYRVYSQPQQGFWCCVGTGMENHGKYGELIYAHDAKDVYVNLFMASTLNWKQNGLRLVQSTTFPYKETSQIKITLNKPKYFSIHLRHPAWVQTGKMKVLVNNIAQAIKSDAASYVSVARKWKTGDVITIVVPMETKAEQLPDKSQWVTFVHGPMVLAAATDTTDLTGLYADDSRMGHIAAGKLYPMDEAPLIVSDKKDLATLVKTVRNVDLSFSVSDATYQTKYKGLKLVPFYTIQNARYVMYWPYTTSQGLASMQKAVKDKEEAALKLDEITVDKVTAGEQQPEADHAYKGENSANGLFKDRHFRNARGWFSYNLKNNAGEAKKIRVTYSVGGPGNKFDIYINGILLSAADMQNAKRGQFFDIDYDLPVDLMKQNAKVLQIKFSAQQNSSTANIYEVRLLK
ncbi:beta-L-arabinofuranosidase domain-containing protein [Mucilaginibacter sp.]|jgi:hypothetical protein|uniref:beta-L-arabinofuranosidase domain-containing protein n=1 Tax=Mucilaginibacter sp. TaxID=1882438 RepID=UPI003564F59B